MAPCLQRALVHFLRLVHFTAFRSRKKSDSPDIYQMPGKRPVPFPEFSRHLWNDRHKPTKTTSVVHAMPEAAPPPSFGISYDEYCLDIAKMSDTQLNGHLACLESNARENTIPTAFERALREAKVSRRAGLVTTLAAVHNKRFFDEAHKRVAQKPEEVKEERTVVEQSYLVKRARVERATQHAKGH